jgi:hypothetical protein
MGGVSRQPPAEVLYHKVSMLAMYGTLVVSRTTSSYLFRKVMPVMLAGRTS